jgi:hypothetical protein
MKKILIMLFLMAMGFSVFANATTEVSTQNAEQIQKKQTERQMAEMQSAVGMPVIDNMFEKKQFKWILEARDNSKLITYAYAFSDYHGKFIFIGKCIGYGLPYSVQYTNPLKIKTFDGGEYGARNPITTPQADPNGLYMPDGLSATWLFMINPKTEKPEPVYFEPTITVTPFPLNERLCIGGIAY